MKIEQYTFENIQIMDHQINWGEIKRLLQSNENGNTTYQNLWETAKAIKRQSVIAYIKEEGREGETAAARYGSKYL
jgi:hypothetical protein